MSLAVSYWFAVWESIQIALQSVISGDSPLFENECDFGLIQHGSLTELAFCAILRSEKNNRENAE